DKVPVLREDEAAVDALAELSQSSGGHGLVVSNGGLAGIVSTSDLARALDARPRRGTSTPSSAALLAGLKARGRVGADDARRLVTEDFVAVGDPGRSDDDVPRLRVERLILDLPPHPARADHDDVVLRRVVYMHLLHLTDRMGDEVDLDVIEPDPFVLVRGADEASVVGLVRDLDHRDLREIAVPAR